MKITYSILALLFIAILITWTQMPRISTDDRAITSLPWIIKINEQGESSVFGLKIGTSSIKQAQDIFNDEAEFGIFEDKNGKKSLEAFFNYTRISGLQARITLTLKSTAENIQQLVSQAIDRKGQPSNSYKYILPSELNDHLLRHTFTSITYQPKIHIEEEILRARFGQPEHIQNLDENTQQWKYPAKGVSILFGKEQKPVIHYVSPDQFNYYFSNDSLNTSVDSRKSPPADLSKPDSEEKHIGKD